MDRFKTAIGPDHNVTERWLPIAEAAEAMGVTAQALRSRIKRNTIRHKKGNDGRLLVIVADTKTGPDIHKKTGPRPPQDRSRTGPETELLAHLQAAHAGEVAALREALTREIGRANQAEEALRKALSRSLLERIVAAIRGN